MDDSLELRKQNLKYYEAHEKGFTGAIKNVFTLMMLFPPTSSMLVLQPAEAKSRSGS